MISKTIKAILLASPSVVEAKKEGISFVVVGDFASMHDLRPANTVFDAINDLKDNADPDSPEDFDFFITVGDNLYVAEPTSPTDAEFDIMMNLFLSRNSIKDLPIYPVRGNHDCLFDDMYAETKLSARYPTW